MNEACQNTDRTLWREMRRDHTSGDSIHITESNGIGIDCGGYVIVAPIRKWHKAGELFLCVNPSLKTWRWKLAMWLLKANKPVKFPKE